MRDLLNTLYNYEYFGIYLMVSISVLILLFIIILFFGKKDKKEREIEATKRLEQVNADAFKEENTVSSVEIANNFQTNEVPTEQVQNISPENLENDTLVFPTIENPSIENLEVNPSTNLESDLSNNNVNEISQNDFNENLGIDLNLNTIPDFNPIMQDEPNNNFNQIPLEQNNVINNEELHIPIQPIINNFTSDNVTTENQDNEIKPILDRVEEKPLIFNDFASVPDNNLTNNNETNSSIFSDIEVPVFNFDEIDKVAEEVKTEPTKNLEVFSSVYTPEKEETNNIPEIEIPEIADVVNLNTLEEDVPEEREETEIPSLEEMDIELPTLKKEVLEEMNQQENKKEEIERPVLNDYNLDELAGETYDLNN